MNRLITISCVVALLLTSSTALKAAEKNVSMGPGYMNDVYISLTDGSTVVKSGTDWDLAFEISGFTAAVHVNNAKGITSYHAFGKLVEQFDVLDTNGMSTDWPRVYGSETTWSSGALNLGVDPNSGNLGWGEYNPITHQVGGTEIFVLQWDETTFKKLIVESLASGVYTIKYANLDGSDERMISIDKKDYQGKNFAYYSMLTHAEIDREPMSAEWDIVVGRYIAYVGPNADTPYGVSGVRSNFGVVSAQVDMVDPATASYSSDITFSEDINIIGHDWKNFDFGAGWQLAEDRAYFIQSADGNIYKIYFTAFGGSSDGNVTFELTDPTSTSVAELNGELLGSVSIFPNPAVNNNAKVAYAINQPVQNARLMIFDLTGRVVMQQEVSAATGMHQIPLNLSNVGAGQYSAVIQLDERTLKATLQIH